MTAGDLALQDAMLENSELREMARSYRELARAAISALHDTQADLDRLRKSHHHALEEYRAVRERLLEREAAAA